MTDQRLTQTPTKAVEKPVIICALIFAVSFCVRLVYLLYYRKSPFFDTYVVDALFHHKWALEILKGDIFSLGQGDVLLKPPFYPYFMALVDLVSNGSAFVLRLIQIVLGSLNCVLVYLIAGKYFSCKSSVIASFIYSFYFVAIYFDAEVEVPCVAIFLMLLSFYLIGATKKWPFLLLSAFSFGFSILTLPTNLLLVPLYLWMSLKKWDLTRSVLYLGIVALVLLPCTLRNLVHGKRFVLISANGGINFYIGNNLHYDKTVAVQPGVAWDYFSAQPYAYKGITSHAEEDRYWYGKAFKYIRQNPVHYVGLLLKKGVLYFTSYEIMRNRDIYYAWRQSIFAKIPFVSLPLIFPAGILGLALSFKGAKNRWELYFFLLLLILPCILFFVTSRYRVPSVAIWSIFGGYFLTEAGKYIQAKKWKTLIGLLAGAVLIGLVARLNIFVVKNPECRPYYNLGYIYSKKEDYNKALECYQRCLELIGSDEKVERMTKAEVAMRIGVIYNIIDKTELSLLYLDKAIELFGDYGKVYFNKGITYLKADKNEAAFATCLKAFEHGYSKTDVLDFFLKTLNRTKPSEASVKAILKSSGNQKLHVMLYNYLGAQQLKRGKFDKAKDCFEKAYAIEPSDSTTLANLGFVALKSNYNKRAAEFYRSSEIAGGKDYDYYYNRGVVEAKSDHLKSGLEYFLQALRFKETASVYYNLGLVYFKLSRDAEAVPYLKKSLEMDKEKEQARSLLEHILHQKVGIEK